VIVLLLLFLLQLLAGCGHGISLARDADSGALLPVQLGPLLAASEDQPGITSNNLRW
jgi:hypothetical protein